MAVVRVIPPGGVWSSSYHAGYTAGVKFITDKQMSAERITFAQMAGILLRKYKNKLPKQYQCSDSRHPFWSQRSKTGAWVEKKGITHLDATLGKAAVTTF